MRGRGSWRGTGSNSTNAASSVMSPVKSVNISAAPVPVATRSNPRRININKTATSAIDAMQNTGTPINTNVSTTVAANSPITPSRTNIVLENIDMALNSESEINEQSEFTNGNRRTNFEGSAEDQKELPKATIGVRKHKFIREHVNPKDAMSCLGELSPNSQYTTEDEGGEGRPICISVEVDGNKFCGFGCTEELASQAAAEAALTTYVKKPPVSDKDEDDVTKWEALASYAIYKMFGEWDEGHIGLFSPPPLPTNSFLPEGFKSFLGQNHGDLTASIDTIPQAYFVSLMNQHLKHRSLFGPVHKEFTKVHGTEKCFIPPNASELNPVMLLNQLKANLNYHVERVEGSTPHNPRFIVSTDIDGQMYVGEGNSVRQAKMFLATDAVASLFDIHSTFQASPKKK